MDQSSAVLLGVTVTSAATLSVVVLQQALARRDRLREAHARRLSDFATSAWTAALTVGVIARQPAGEKDVPVDALERNRTLAFDAYNNALNLILLLEAIPIAEAARRFDQGLRTLEREARTRQFTRDEWRDLRLPLRRLYSDYLVHARKTMNMPPLPWEVE